MIPYNPILQTLSSHLFAEKKLTVDVLRLDLTHPEISGNKWFKLKYNLEAAKKQGYDTILTFGGAFSNHIYATAAACKLYGLNSIGIIRGEKSSASNPTLCKAAELGMTLHFVPREYYKHKDEFYARNDLIKKFGSFFSIPEGGYNLYGVMGCTEILRNGMDHDTVFCAYGTGATFKSLREQTAKQKIIGVRVLKDDTAEKNVLNGYHFGGYAKHTSELLEFKKSFETEFKIPLDYVYTAKLAYAVFDSVKKNKFKKGTKIMIIHSGGLQGNKGYETRYSLNPSL